MIKQIILYITLITIPFSCYAVNYSDMGITDDEIANGISHPKPPSVTQAIKYIKDNDSINEIEDFDISCNNICINGATQILIFANTDLINLKTLDLSHNRIYDWRGTDDYDKFEVQLLSLLEKQAFQAIDLRVNNIDNLNWFQYFTKKAGLNSWKLNQNTLIILDFFQDAHNVLII